MKMQSLSKKKEENVIEKRKLTNELYLIQKRKKLKRKKHFDRYYNNENYRMKSLLRSRIIIALKNNNKSMSTMKLLGCSIEQLWNHLEKQFKKGMTRENQGLWHIDHIKPCAAFDLTKLEEQQKCFHYTNLQPLWAKENLMKSDKYEKTNCLSD